MSVVFRLTPLYQETKAFYERTQPEIKKLLGEFLDSKRKNPLAPFGSKDYPFKNVGHYRGFMHAHLTRDVSVVYTLSGKDPHVISLYMIASHADLGTSNPPNLKKQTQVGKKLAQQQFNK